MRLNCVLLIDDDSVSNYISENVLRSMGAASMITVVTDGRKALDYLKYQCVSGDEEVACPELILLDLHMPNIDGLEFLDKYRKMKSIDHNKIIIVLSALELPDHEKVRLRSIGVTDFLVKPFNAQKLGQILDRYFEPAS